MDLTGCCGDMAAVNFSLIEFPEVPITLRSCALWLSLLFMIVKPCYKAVVGVWEHRNGYLKSKFGHAWAFILYTLTSHLLGLITFVSFHYSLHSQPHFPTLHRNTILVLAYVVLFLGFGFKTWAYFKAGGAKQLGGELLSSKGTVAPLVKNDYYYHPDGTGSVMVYAGFALLRARLAGLVLTGVLATCYYLAPKLERAHLTGRLDRLWDDWARFKTFLIKLNTQMGRREYKRKRT